jgi:hypothetical protein
LDLSFTLLEYYSIKVPYSELLFIIKLCFMSSWLILTHSWKQDFFLGGAPWVDEAPIVPGLFHKCQGDLIIFCRFYLFWSQLFTCRLSAVSHICSWHRNAKLLGVPLQVKVLVKFTVCCNIQIFLKWGQLTFSARFVFNSHADCTFSV